MEYGSMMESDDSNKDEEGDTFFNLPDKSDSWETVNSPREQCSKSQSWGSAWPTSSAPQGWGASPQATESDPWGSVEVFSGFSTVPTKSISKRDADVDSSHGDSSVMTVLPSSDPWGTATLASAKKPSRQQRQTVPTQAVGVPPEASKQPIDSWGEVPQKSLKSLQEPSHPLAFSVETTIPADPWGSTSTAPSSQLALPLAACPARGSDAGVALDPWSCVDTPTTSRNAHPEDFWLTGLTSAAAAGNTPVVDASCTVRKMPADPWGDLPCPAAATTTTGQAVDVWAEPALAAFPDPWSSTSSSDSAQAVFFRFMVSLSSGSQQPVACRCRDSCKVEAIHKPAPSGSATAQL